jgi:hypothetical protein
MCDTKRRGTASEAMENMQQPIPRTQKARMVLRNTWQKIRTRSDCCGNYGEPGC